MRLWIRVFRLKLRACSGLVWTRCKLFFLVVLRPNAGHGLLILEVSRLHTTTYHSRQDFSGREISSSQRPLPDNTQHSQQTDIHATGGIETHDLSRRAAADLRFRPRGHWNRHCSMYTSIKLQEYKIANIIKLSVLGTTLSSFTCRRWVYGGVQATQSC